MMAKYPDELTCDMAETYGVFDIYRLPARLAAKLAVGLRDDSRVKKAKTKTTVPDETLLLACIADCVRWLKWSRTEDGLKGVNHPKSILNDYLGIEEPEPEHLVFDDPADFWNTMETITKR